MNKKVGVKDIALKSGVSTGTVDRVLNNRGRVSDETRKKVLQIAKQLGYQPNLLAKTLSSKKTTKLIICLPAPHADNPYWEKVLVGIDRAKDEFANYNVSLRYLSFDASSEDSFSKVLDEAISDNPDGIVFSPVFSNSSTKKVKLLNEKSIPFVFVDINIKGVGKLAYFGQEALQSGRVAGMLMKTSLQKKSKILVVKMARHLVFSTHINARVDGFLELISGPGHEVKVIDVDLNMPDEPRVSLSKMLQKEHAYQGIFIPNSRGFKVAEYLEKQHINKLIVIGYDLLDQNIEYLNKDRITFLINQKPEEQVFDGLMALFNHIILKKEISKKSYSPIDIVVKENVKYYK